VRTKTTDEDCMNIFNITENSTVINLSADSLPSIKVNITNNYVSNSSPQGNLVLLKSWNM